MISPLSLTVISWSSSSTTAFASSAYFFTCCWASERNQSGTPAFALAGTRLIRKRNNPALITFLSTVVASLQDCLLFVSRLYRVEKSLYFPILLHREIHAIQQKLSLGGELASVELAYALVSCIRKAGILRLRHGFNRESFRQFYADRINLRKCVAEIDRIFSFYQFERIQLPRLEEVHWRKHAFARGGGVRRNLHRERYLKWLITLFPVFGIIEFNGRALRQPLP